MGTGPGRGAGATALSGRADAEAARDYTVKIDVVGLLDIDAARVRNEFWFVPMVGQPTDEESLGAVFECAHGTQRRQRSD